MPLGREERSWAPGLGTRTAFGRPMILGLAGVRPAGRRRSVAPEVSMGRTSAGERPAMFRAILVRGIAKLGGAGFVVVRVIAGSLDLGRVLALLGLAIPGCTLVDVFTRT
jgi:hypothetical protein